MSKSRAESRDREFVIVGGGGHARVIACLLRSLSERIAGYTALGENPAMQYDFLGNDEFLFSMLDPRRYAIAMGIGIPRLKPERLDLLLQLIDSEFVAAPLISANASVAEDARIGDGSAVLDGAVLATGVRLGKGCIVNHNASVDHDCRLGRNTHVAPGATICADVEVGDNTMIGAGATVVPGVSIAANCMIGAGATVVSNCKESAVYVGTPARERQAGAN